MALLPPISVLRIPLIVTDALNRSNTARFEFPDGHVKFHHPWLPKLSLAGRPDYGDTGLMVMRETAFLSR